MRDMTSFIENTISYVLMNKNTEILKFDATMDEYGDVYFVQTTKASVLPIGFIDIQHFIEKRRAPKTRKHITELLNKSGCHNLITFLDVTFALSLNDTFWIKRSDADITWKSVSLYSNSFNEVIANLAFDGVGISQSSSSPEYTTDGMSAKCWHRYDDGIYLCKKNSQGTYEAESEYYASQIFEAFCPDSVSYRINYLHDNLVSECPIFTNETYGFVPCSKLFQSKPSVKTYLEYYDSIGGYSDFFRRMLIVDALVLNVDRHRGNFGFLAENDTQKIIKPAPVFDFNRCFLYDQDNFTDEYFQQITPRIGGDFNVVANQLLTDDLRKDLIDLKGFVLKPTGTSKERSEVMSHVVNKQIDNVLNGKPLYKCKFF